MLPQGKECTEPLWSATWSASNFLSHAPGLHRKIQIQFHRYCVPSCSVPPVASQRWYSSIACDDAVLRRTLAYSHAHQQRGSLSPSQYSYISSSWFVIVCARAHHIVAPQEPVIASETRNFAARAERCAEDEHREVLSDFVL
jgi:hypothetical protein